MTKTIPPSKFRALPEEIRPPIIQHAVTASPEHAGGDNEGNYSPAKFDMRLLDIDKGSRIMLADQISRKFAFIELRFMSCSHRGLDPEAVQHFAETFGLFSHQKLLMCKERHQIKLSSVRVDITCPDNRCHELAKLITLVLTEATPFAELLICAMIQRRSFGGWDIDITLQAQSRSARKTILRSLNSVKRYLRVTRVTRVNGVDDRTAQDFLRIVNTPLTTLEDLITIHETHIRDIEALNATGLSFITMLPLAVQLLLAYGRKFNRIGAQLVPKDQLILDYYNSLQCNYTDMVARGLATYLLTRSADRSHYVIATEPSAYILTSTLEHHLNTLKYSEEKRDTMALPDASEPTALERPIKLEEMHKSQTLLELALARFRLFPDAPMCDKVRTALENNGRTVERLFWNSGHCLSSVRLLVVDPLDLKIDREYAHLTNNAEVDELAQGIAKLNLQTIDPAVEGLTNTFSKLSFEAIIASATDSALKSPENLPYDLDIQLTILASINSAIKSIFNAPDETYILKSPQSKNPQEKRFPSTNTSTFDEDDSDLNSSFSTSSDYYGSGYSYNSDSSCDFDLSGRPRTAETILNPSELAIYNPTRLWLQQTHLITNAIDRAAFGSLESRKKGLAVVSEPLLHSVGL